MIVFETARLCVQWVLPAGAQEEANSWNQLVGKHASQTGHEPVPDALESRLKLIRHARSGRLAASQEASSGWDTLRANSIAEQMPSKREHVPGALCSVSVCRGCPPCPQWALLAASQEAAHSWDQLVGPHPLPAAHVPAAAPAAEEEPVATTQPAAVETRAARARRESLQATGTGEMGVVVR